MHFDQFIAVQKGKFYFFTTHPIFSIVSPCILSNEKYWKVNSIFQIYWYVIVDQIHTYQILQTDCVTAHAQLIFEKLSASCIRRFI